MSKDLERFMSKVNTEGLKVPGMGLNCWEWTGAIDAKGRPRFLLNMQGKLARRALKEILAGQPLPEDSYVAALCSNPTCVRPEHLVLCNKPDADALGQHGHIGAGSIYQLRIFHSEGYSVEELAFMHEISIPLVRAILTEGTIDV